MSRNLITVVFGTEVNEAWQLLHRHEVKGLPVVDNFNRVLGVVTFADFVRHANIDESKPVKEKIKAFLKKTDGENSNKAEVVGQIMSSPAVAMNENDHAIQLIPFFTERGIHHIPIIDDKKRLVGMVTNSDLLRAISLLTV